MARLLAPVPIAYGEAIGGRRARLAVNLVQRGAVARRSSRPPSPWPRSFPWTSSRQQSSRCLCPRAGRAATSVLASPRWLPRCTCMDWADPAVGIIGAVVIGSWAIGLIRAGRRRACFDVNSDGNFRRPSFRSPGDAWRPCHRLHLWQVGPGHRAAVISLISDNPLPPSQYKRRPQRPARP